MRLNQLHHRMPPLRAPILTEMVVSASMASVLMRCCSSHNRSRDGLLIRTICMRRMHHMRGGADDVTWLLIAALTALTHANRPWQRSPAVLAMRCHLLRALCWLATVRMRRVHHMRGGADDVTGLSTAALTASTHANLSGCSGHADQSRPSVDAAASCS